MRTCCLRGDFRAATWYARHCPKLLDMASTKSSPFGSSPGATPAPVFSDASPETPVEPVTGLVGTTTKVALATLSTYYKNPRRGNTELIANSLRTHGQYKPICANIGTKTGRPNEVLAGNHTLMAMRDLAETDGPAYGEILVHWVDVDEDTAARIVAVDNRASEVGSTDNDTLLELLQGLDPAKGLEGTGFDEDYVQMLVELTSGPPDLDDLADEHGDPKDTDAHDSVRLILGPEVSRRWTAWRSNYPDDTDALAALLDTAEAP
ncbi:ParB-like nuclease domain protein [Mycobacterium phage Lars]|uniref:Helix-turn-helix DNA binding domain protein n=7 Tax=Rosebushvirus TaxID=1982900 RepID=A0A0Y0AA96_9CAUD|nr:ParB-like partition protein [Mycobacterium phage Rosebush]YP_655681.1 ParB-like partition protein [Mycobacterium phage Qyrzula]AEN79505.1 transcriptional regulator [Mycobacterium phage Arbiter]AIK68775.1 hypothetical protein PBI_LIZLEMON_1 [Mycobacterium phage LizLemon]AMB17315.1 helix-turn-helix DNA binding domain protein [Mycobacterium phage Glass]QFG13955.1 helix-turn-helix DNA binding domain protein [Mycobacterium phage Rhinoforte]QWY80923.1 ParB-like nuclease domain protein [Mycobacte